MSADERFDFYTEKSDACWMWKGSHTRRYGTFWAHGKNIGAHVYAYRRFKGEVAPGMFVCHTCDVPLCVNPEHLFVGTPKDNTQDMMRKNRGAWPRGDQHHLSKLSESDIEEIFQLRKIMTQSAIAKKFGVDQSHISRIVRGHKRGRVQFAPLT